MHPPTAAPHGWAVTIFTCWQSLRGAVGRDSGAPAEKLEPGRLRDPRRETAPSLTHTHFLSPPLRPFKSLIRPLKGLIRPFKSLIRLLKGLIRL